MKTTMGIGLLGGSSITFRHRKWYWTLSLNDWTFRVRPEEKGVLLRAAANPVAEGEADFLGLRLPFGPALRHGFRCELWQEDPGLGRTIDLMVLAAGHTPVRAAFRFYDGCDCLMETFALTGAVLCGARQPLPDPGEYPGLQLAVGCAGLEYVNHRPVGGELAELKF